MRVFVSHLIRKGIPAGPGTPLWSSINTPLWKTEIRQTRIPLPCSIISVRILTRPGHYHAAGLTINEIPKERFFYQHPLLLDIPKGRLEKIEVSDLQPYEDSLKVCDLLMLAHRL